MLQNMSQAAQSVSTQRPNSNEGSTKMQGLNLDSTVRSGEMLSPQKATTNMRRVFASKTLPNGRLSKTEDNKMEQPLVQNPDEDEQQLESELKSLKENMRQIE